MSKHYIYMCSNLTMPNLIKIGKTTKTPKERLKELSTTGVPEPFDLELAFEVEDCHDMEAKMHKSLSSYRYSTKREFFSVTVEQAAKVFFSLAPPCSYKIFYARDSFGLEIIANDIENKKIASEKELQAKKAQLLEHKRERLISESNSLQAQVDEAHERLISARKDYAALGKKPHKSWPHRQMIKVKPRIFPEYIGWVLFCSFVLIFMTFPDNDSFAFKDNLFFYINLIYFSSMVLFWLQIRSFEKAYLNSIPHTKLEEKGKELASHYQNIKKEWQKVHEKITYFDEYYSNSTVFQLRTDLRPNSEK